jgi:CMP-N-acetylneuraminic acid synthetase
VLAVIPARGGSKGIKRKALHPLNGIPLIEYTLKAARESNLDAFFISTDDEEIARYGPSILRPSELAQDDTPMLPVIQHAVSVFGRPVEAVMTLQPTSPLRTAEDINKALEMWARHKFADSLISVTAGVHPIKCYDRDWRPFMWQYPYDKRKHVCYVRNGAIFITRMDLLESGRLIGDNPMFYVMPKTRSVDVDSLEDLAIAEALLK